MLIYFNSEFRQRRDAVDQKIQNKCNRTVERVNAQTHTKHGSNPITTIIKPKYIQSNFTVFQAARPLFTYSNVLTIFQNIQRDPLCITAANLAGDPTANSLY